ncbi:MAG TPA: hypothetical protein VIY28_12275 [Pseudonocardiaceae bacterium]
MRAAAAEPVDDPRVCPPTLRGQRLLFRPRLRLTEAHARRIKDRDLADYDRLKQTAIALAAERGLSTAWWRGTCLMIRLALAVRDADGDDLIVEETLDDLPGSRNATVDVLRHAGLTGAAVLRPRRRARPVVPAKPQRSCKHCDCWGFRALCQECANWKHHAQHPVGDCSRCSRPKVPLLNGLCRACCVHINTHGPAAQTESWTQLWLGGELAPRLAMRTGTLGYVAPHHKTRARTAARRPPPISPHLIDPAQGTLFDARRDWTCVAKGSLDRLPSLTPIAEALLEEFQQHARTRGCDEQVRRIAARSLRILLAWIGADAPIHEADIWALPADRPGTSARHVLHFLTDHKLVITDPARQIDIHHQAIQTRLQELPAGIADELRRWVLVLRGEGRREHRPMSFETIRKYLSYLHPILAPWAGRVTSLREITGDDIRHILKQRPGQPAQDLASALRSLFQALKQERLIFRDPTRGISLPAVVRLPVPIPTDPAPRPDRPSRVSDGQARHRPGRYPRPGQTRNSPAPADRTRPAGRDLDRPAKPGRHAVYLDELTHTLAVEWLRERHRRWPLTTNPHLLLSQQTATMDTLPPISSMVMNDIFRPLGLSPSKLRQDRILDEARHTADPVHLMRVFGITARTAMKYVYTAHPERRSTLPR